MKFTAIICVPKLNAKYDERIVSVTNIVRQVAEINGIDFYMQDSNAFGKFDDRHPLFVSLGGDGTMLAAMRDAATSQGGSVVGFNFGRLGFLTNEVTDKDDLFFKLQQLVTDPLSWKVDNRMLIKALVTPPRDYRQIRSVAVNEFLVTTKTRAHPLTYNIFINDAHVAQQTGDGVIVSTATGSTAYAMSAGGAVMAPTSRAIQIVPLAAHTLSSRPIVVSEDDTIRIEATRPTCENDILLLRDNNHVHTTHEISVEISKHKIVPLWRLPEWNSFDVLREKLGWNYEGK